MEKACKKVFMSIDIEGINGICNWDETELNNPSYEQFRQELQREVNAACKGAIEAGATEIVIKDAHDSAPDFCSCCAIKGLSQIFLSRINLFLF